MTQALIAAAVRSPIGRANKGSLTQMRPDDLAAQMVRAALDRVPELDPALLNDLMLGCAQPAGEGGYNLARAVAVLSGYDRLPGTTVNRYCSSSLQTTRMAFHAIRAGEGSAFLSAGVETVSRYGKGAADEMPETHNPAFAEADARTAERAHGADGWSDPRTDGALPDLYISMGQTAENVAQALGISRREQDEFGVRSQTLAQEALANGFWAREITPVTLPDGGVVTADDGPRPGVTLEGVSVLAPVFRPDGTVTAANCCPLNDGASALVVTSDPLARSVGIQPLARIVSTGVSGLSPEIMGLGPIEATRQALNNAGMSIADVDLVEINEAFAVQVLGSARALDIPEDRLNINGGAIAVGHPFGMTGARLITTMINSLDFHDKQVGLITMCVGGGQGMAMIIERM